MADPQNQVANRKVERPGFPSTAHQFQPGQSGNPGGRPRNRSITARLRELLDKNEIAGKPIKDGRQVADLVAEVLLKEALKGKYPHLKELLDRVEGKVPDRIAGPDGGAVVLKWEDAEPDADDADDDTPPDPDAAPPPGPAGG